MLTATRYPDLAGQRFGAYTVLHREQNAEPRRYWRCRCDCGQERVVSTTYLTSGRARSCGCGLDGLLLGTWVRGMDRKGRVALPLELRRRLGGTIWFTRGLPGYVVLLSARQMPRMAARWLENPDRTVFLASALRESPVDPSTGRVMVPDVLRDHARLIAPRRPAVAIAGVGDAVVLCEASRWDAEALAAHERLLGGAQ